MLYTEEPMGLVDFWAPLGVCKVENAQNCAFSLSFGLKPHRLRKYPRFQDQFVRVDLARVVPGKAYLFQPAGVADNHFFYPACGLNLTRKRLFAR
jgi:hypothetical protein